MKSAGNTCENASCYVGKPNGWARCAIDYRSCFEKSGSQSGATLFEYALILFLVSIIAIVILQGIGGKTNNMVTTVNNAW